MNVGLFIPCYVNQFYPQVAIATLQLLEKYNCRVHYPAGQTCCGQPMANSGYEKLGKGCNELITESFADFDYIVCPSGSCTLHIKDHLHSEKNEPAAQGIRKKIYELAEFMVDVLQVENLEASFPHKVGVHQSCHGQRGLHISQMSELVAPPYSKTDALLKKVKGLELVKLDRVDECCGFGGTFCVVEESISARMGQDRVADHERNGVEVITGGDMSCLMHLEGVLKRKKSKIVVKHIVEILVSGVPIAIGK